MRYLLDTHTFAWAVGSPERLSKTVRTLLLDPANTVLISAVSIWEMSVKHQQGRWPEVAPFLDEALYKGFLTQLRASDLSINRRHARLAGQWPEPHRDPFDRLLAAQALLEGVPLLSRDAQLDGFAIQRIW